MRDEGLSMAGGHGGDAEQSGGYEPVRDSWVELPPATSHRAPPALPVTGRALGDPSLAAARAALVDRMLERLAASDYAGALMSADAVLARAPDDADALDCAAICRSELRKVHEARLGSLDRAPVVALSAAELAVAPFDALSGSLLARVDGVATLRELCLIPGVAPEHALRVLSELYLRGVIALGG